MVTVVNIFLPIACAILCAVQIHGQWYTGLADMVELVEMEHVLLCMLNNSIMEQEHRLAFLKRHLFRYTNEHEKATKDPQEYLSNPVNSYLLLKRLTTDWKNTEQLLQNNLYQVISHIVSYLLQIEVTDNIMRYRADDKFPTDEDLNGAAVALLRLQDTYKLDTSSVAQGELNGIQYDIELTSGDCFELGRQSHNVSDHYHTILWMNEALHRYELERYTDNDAVIEKWEILQYLAYSTYKEGNVYKALYLIDELLKLYPEHKEAKEDREIYVKAIEEELKTKSATNESELEMKDVDEYDKIITRYKQLCRKEVELPVSVSSTLRCRYVNYGNPFLLLAPLKEEEAYLNPRILLFREVMYPSEIDVIKTKAKPGLKRALVLNNVTSTGSSASYRICKSASLDELEDPIFQRINRRVEHMTSLTTEYGEQLKVVNYGIGGHYEPHYDFFDTREINQSDSLHSGENRIATVLFYMSNVEQGGATVFPSLDLALWPVEGTAAFWYNLHTSGEGDYNTRHAACPVLQGYKWISTKWLIERGQEFLRPCDPTDAVNTLL